MPLDTGEITDLHLDAEDRGDAGLVESYAPTLHSASDIGQALKSVREFRGLTLEDVAETTRVRRAYLTAIEEMRLELLPSRPFTIGYIRAYAVALGLDGEAAVERFKAEEPVLDEPLREPVGVSQDRDPRFTAIIIGAVLLIGAIVLWNLAQRAMTASAPPPPTAPATATVEAMAAAKGGPVSLGAPLPAPVESTTPAPYETPGLAQAGEDGMGNHAPPAILGATPENAPPPDLSSLPASFKPEGAVYGAAAGQPSMVTLQALKSAALIVRGADGSVYFARQLDKGEAYRVPQAPGLVVDVSEPQAFHVFSAGQSKGLLPGALTAAGKLGG
jgi:cytoskeleton protein RodZ